VEYWEFDGAVYEVVSFYSVAGDRWSYELTGPDRSCVAVIIPDVTPEAGPFTAEPSTSVRVITTDGTLPWPVLIRFMDLVESSGDIKVVSGGPAMTADVHLSRNEVVFADRRYEINSFFLSEQDCWCYELYQSVPVLAQNDFIDVRIPDPAPDGQPDAPQPAGLVVLRSHGECDVPWPVFRLFLDLVTSDEHLSGTSLPEPTPGPSVPDSAGPRVQGATRRTDRLLRGPR
jgi:hypothetical protein